MPPTTLRVAAVQMPSQLGDRPANLCRATRHVEAAARQGARLVLLPELMPGGYTLNKRIWDTAEPFDGETTRWLRPLCRDLGVYAGTTFLEADGHDFYNTFIFVDPDGRVLGRVRKSPPASFEAFFFRGGDDPHWIDTPFGRVGVGICFENLLYRRYRELHDVGIDLYLRPFSGGSFQARFPARPRDIRLVEAAVRDGTAAAARALGVPAVTANQVGRRFTTLPVWFPAQRLVFPGFSAVADGDGRLLGLLEGGREGVVVGTVTLDAARKAGARARRRHGPWTDRMPWWSSVFLVSQKLGELHYRHDRDRARRAAAAAASDPAPACPVQPAGVGDDGSLAGVGSPSRSR